MRKSDELVKPTSCFNRAAAHTNVFVLVDWDPATADTIREWAKKRIALGLNSQEDHQIVEALNLADEIEENLAKVRETRAARATALNPAAAWPFPNKS